MKVVHLNKEPEKGEDHQSAIKELEQVVKAHPTNEKAWNRLMILYRKTGELIKELNTIDTAVKIFEEVFNKNRPVYNKKIASLSKALSKAMGLSDKKGNSLYEMGELAKWKRRKQTVLKKLKR